MTQTSAAHREANEQHSQDQYHHSHHLESFTPEQDEGV